MSENTKELKDWKQLGALCWVEREIKKDTSFKEGSQIAFEEGIINQEIFRKTIRVKINGREEEIQSENVSERSEIIQDEISDMVDLKILNDAEVTAHIQQRYQKGKIYTFIGPTLLAVNPFNEIEEQISEKIVKSYFQDMIEYQRKSLKQVDPHIFAIAAESYNQLFEMQKNQAIVITGESGSGKTENSKLCMKFLATAAHLLSLKVNIQPFRSKIMKHGIEKKITSIIQSMMVQEQKVDQSIEDKILSCNPILESFGSAKTILNDNSSRFGKYIEILVNLDTSKIVGTQITNYLLEKVRIVHQEKEEYNFHIFYILLYGADKKLLNSLFLEKQGEYGKLSFFYLKNQVYPNAQNYPFLFQELIYSLKLAGLSDYQGAIFNILASILHIGNLKFLNIENDENHPCSILNKDELKIISNLLGVDGPEIERELTCKQTIVNGESYTKFLNQDECNVQRDSLTKELYNQLFNWIVSQLNITLQSNEANNESVRSIGLLDIYGFEVLPHNGYEQFFINYANEKLQQLYIQYVFKVEEQVTQIINFWVYHLNNISKVFRQEGLQNYFKRLNFKDNQDVLEILEGQKEPLGIVKLLEDRCKNPAASLDSNLLNDIRKKHGDKEKIIRNPFYRFKNPKKMSTTAFIIVHSIREVEYDINGFIEKNKDDVNMQLIAEISQSRIPFLSDIIQPRNEIDESSDHSDKSNKSKQKQKQISQKFISDVSKLLNELMQCNTYFVRCIKPNEDKQPSQFNQRYAVNQIRYLGVLESINVRKQSYPIRFLYQQFYKKYGLMMLELQKQSLDIQKDNSKFATPVKTQIHIKIVQLLQFSLCSQKRIFSKLFSHLKEDNVIMGKTKVFLKSHEILREIQDVYAYKTQKMEKSAIKLQRRFWQFHQVKKFRKFLKAVRNIQMKWRAYTKKLVSSVIIQTYIRTHIENSQYMKKKKQVIFIQKQWKISLLKLRNIRYSRTKYNYVINKSLLLAWNIIINRSAQTLQRMIKGCYVRSLHQSKVLKIRSFILFTKQNKAAHKIQCVGRGYIVRKKLKLLNRSAQIIQGYFKMKWFRNLYHQMKMAASIISRNVLSFLRKTRERQKKNAEFIAPIMIQNHKFQLQEQAILFNHVIDLSTNPLIQESAFENNNNNAICNNNHNHVCMIDRLLEKSHEEYFKQKIYLFSSIIDFEILCDISDIYYPQWSSLYEASFQDTYEKQSYIQHLSVGDTHTISCTLNSKLHTWGWNDCGQLGIPIEKENIYETFNQSSSRQIYQINIPYQIQRITQVSTGSNHNILLDHKGSIWSWGANNKELPTLSGQLGLNHYENMETPVRIQCGKNEFTKIEARDNENFAVTKEGKLFHWPSIEGQGGYVNYPVEIFIPQIQIKDVSCGNNFSILLTINGLLFSFGSDNREGELGLGDKIPRKVPTLLASLKDAGEKVVQIDCGFKHTICKTSLGKVFTWGRGERGQLGHGEFRNELLPRFLKSSRLAQDKCLQVAAGHRCSLVLLESRKIFQFGTNSSIDLKSDLTELNLKYKSDKLSQGFYEPVRIQTSWSKTLSIIYVTFGNTRKAFEHNVVFKSKILNTLISKWAESNIDTVDPPFVEKVANLISEKNMKMPLLRMTNIQFESKKQHQKVKKDVKEFNYLHQIEEEYLAAQQVESQDIYNKMIKPESDQRNINHKQQDDIEISEKKQQELKETFGADWKKENWNQFEQLELAASVTDSQIQRKEQQYFDKIKQQQQQQLEEQLLLRKKQLEEQERELKQQQLLSDKLKQIQQMISVQTSQLLIQEQTKLMKSPSKLNIRSQTGVDIKQTISGRCSAQSVHNTDHENNNNKNLLVNAGKQPQTQNQTKLLSIQYVPKSQKSSLANLHSHHNSRLLEDSQQNISLYQDRLMDLKSIEERMQKLSLIPSSQWNQGDEEFVMQPLIINTHNNVQEDQQLEKYKENFSKRLQQSREILQKSRNKLEKSQERSQSKQQILKNDESEQQQYSYQNDPILVDLKAKWLQVLNTPRSDWTSNDIKFMNVVEVKNFERVFKQID